MNRYLDMTGRRLTIITILVCAIGFFTQGCNDDYITGANFMAMPREDSFLDGDSEYFIVLGDLQAYTYPGKELPYLQKTMDWIDCQLQCSAPILMVLQTGDISETNAKGEWKRFQKTAKTVAFKVPFVAITGNHDYTWKKGSSVITDRKSSRFDEYLDFALSRAFTSDRYDVNSIHNRVITNYVNDFPLDILCLEFAPRPAVVEWADSLVKANPDRHYILMTHEFLDVKNELPSGKWSYASIQFPDGDACTPVEVWERLVSPNDNIVCVLCGHNGYYQVKEKQNASGATVPIIMFNLQYQEHGGNGLVQIWRFPKGSDKAYIRVFDTVNRQYVEDPVGGYEFTYKIR